MSDWYVLRTKPHKETAVCRLLKSREITVFYPTIEVDPVNPRSARIRPYFPGYLFVQTDLEVVGRNSLDWLPGSQGLVSFGGEPAEVSDDLVEAIKTKTAVYKKKQKARKQFASGDKVRIIDGPLAGYDAIFDTALSGQQRVQVLLTYLHNQPKPVKMNRSDIIKLN